MGSWGTSPQESQPQTSRVGAQGSQCSSWQPRALSDIRVAITKEGCSDMASPPVGSLISDSSITHVLS